MHFATTTTLATIALAVLSAARPAKDPKDIVKRNWEVYATFYDDNYCTVNAGEAVSTANPGCLANEYNRNSIYFQSGEVTEHSLLWSPGSECDCQVGCQYNLDNGGAYCYNMAGNPGASSFRFISGECPANNC